MPQALPWAAAALAKAAIAVGAPTAVAKVAAVLVVKTALSAAVSVGANMLIQPKVDKAGSPTQWRANPDEPAPVLTGRLKVAGAIVKRKGFGPENMYQGIVGIVSGAGPVQGPAGWMVDRQPVTFGGDQKAVAPWGDKLWLSYQLGAQPEPSALASPAGLRASADLTGWTAAHKLSSWAGYMVTLGHDSKAKVWTRGEPEFAGVWDGVLDWDPRLDDTYPGGSGDQRRDDPTTWGAHENPILFGLRWARGHWAGENGGIPHVDELVCGMGVRDELIDIASFVECANMVDALGWTCAARPTAADDKWQVLCAYLQAGGCYPDTINGRLTCLSRVGAKVSLATLSRSDILGSIEAVRSPRRLERRNTVRPRYRSRDHDWEIVTAAKVDRPEYLAEDGGRRRAKPIDYPYVCGENALDQVAVLAAYDVADSREPFVGGMAVKAWLRRYPPGCCVDMPDDETLGSLANQKILIRSREVDPMTGGLALGFAGETDEKHTWAMGTTTTVPDPVPFDPPSLTFPAPDAGDWTFTAGALGTGATQPALFLDGASTNPLASGIFVEYRVDGTTPWSQWADADGETEHFETTAVAARTDYEVSIRYRSEESGLLGARLILGPETTGGVVIDWDDQPPPGPTVLDDWDVLRAPGSAGGVNVAGDLSLKDTAGTADIAPNAITESVSSYLASAQTLSGTTPVTLRTVTVTTTGEPVDISCRFLLEAENPTAFGMIFRIWRTDGISPTVIFQEVLGNLAFKDAGANYRCGQPYTAAWTDQPSAGAYSYFMEVEFTINTGFSIQEASNRYLSALRRLR